MSQPTRIVIGLGGRPGAGKDAVALLLKKAWGIEWLAFADSLKDELSETMRIDRVLFDCVQTKGMFRGLMQYWGAMRRSEDVDYWVKRSGLLDGTHSVAVTDCRHVNELEAVRSLGGTCIWIGNAEAEAVQYADISEMLSPSDFECVVNNDKSNPLVPAIQVSRIMWELGHPAVNPSGMAEWRDALLRK